MYMQDWIRKLDDFLKLTDREILAHAGQISHDQALDRAAEEFKKYRVLTANDPTTVDRDFVAAVDELTKSATRPPTESRPDSKAKKPPKRKGSK